MLLDGQVNHTFGDAVSYTATLTLLDPDNLISFDTSSPSDNALYADRMIRIIYSVSSEILPRWVDVPIFCGPVTKVDRDDAVLSVECQGKEALVSPPMMAWTTRNYRKGQKLTAVVRDALAVVGGETKFDLPEWPNTLPKDYGLMPESGLWTFVRTRVGSRTVRHLFYDGRGVCRLRGSPTRPVFTFTEAHLLSVPKLNYNHADIRNGVRVRGATPEGKPQITRTRGIPGNDPSGAITLGRNGVNRHLIEIIEDSSLMTQAEVDAQAEQSLDSLRVSNVGFDFDSFPIPHLEPGASSLCPPGTSVSTCV